MPIASVRLKADAGGQPTYCGLCDIACNYFHTHTHTRDFCVCAGDMSRLSQIKNLYFDDGAPHLLLSALGSLLPVGVIDCSSAAGVH